MTDAITPQILAHRTVSRLVEKRSGISDQRSINHADFAAQRLKILAKDKRLVPLTYNRVQVDLLSHLTGRDLVLKARQHGVSTAIQGYLYQQAVTGTATTMTLAHDDDSTQKLRRITERFYRNDPRQPQRGSANARLTTYPEHDSEVMIATAGNRTSGRSATLSDLHGSEVAFWPDAESLVAAAIQAGDPRVILESTPNGAQGYFYSLCMEALDGNSDWVLHFYPWWWEPGYRIALDEGEALSYTDDEQTLVEAYNLTSEQIKWRRSKQRELKHLFIQEYPEDPQTCFLRSGLGYFGDVSACFAAPNGATYNPAHQYVAGLDFGQTVDYTALSIGDVTTGQEVELLRVNQMSWSDMRSRVVQACQRWHVGILWAEKNSMGSTNIEELRKELGTLVGVQEFTTTSESKASLMSALHETLHADDGLRLLPDTAGKRELQAFSAMQLPSGAWRLSAPDNEHDDTVIARGLMNYGRVNRIIAPIVFDWDAKETSDW